MEHAVNQSFTPPHTNSCRNLSLDWISGILMIKIILMHMTPSFDIAWFQEFNHFLGYTLFMFMPWFFFKAGMYNKPTHLHRCFKTSAKRLLLPWLIFGLFGLAVFYLTIVRHPHDSIKFICDSIRTVVIELAMPGNLALWFLMSLFVCRIFTSAIKISTTKHAHAMAIIGFLLAFLLYKYPPELYGFTMVFPDIFMALFFYAAGYIFRYKQYDKRIAIVAVVILAGLSVLDHSILDMRTNGVKSLPVTYVLFYPRALCGIIVFNYIIANLLPQAYLSKSILSYIGRNSMGYYVLHMPLILLCRIVSYQIPALSVEGALFMTLVILTVSLPLLDILLRRYWPEALGLRRDKKRMTAPDELP